MFGSLPDTRLSRARRITRRDTARRTHRRSLHRATQARPDDDDDSGVQLVFDGPARRGSRRVARRDDDHITDDDVPAVTVQFSQASYTPTTTTVNSCSGRHAPTTTCPRLQFRVLHPRGRDDGQHAERGPRTHRRRPHRRGHRDTPACRSLRRRRDVGRSPSPPRRTPPTTTTRACSWCSGPCPTRLSAGSPGATTINITDDPRSPCSSPRRPTPCPRVRRSRRSDADRRPHRDAAGDRQRGHDRGLTPTTPACRPA